MRQESGLIAPTAGLFGQIPGQQVGRVGFYHYPVQGQVAYGIPEIGAPAIIAEPAGDPDIQVHVQVVTRHLRRTRKAMSDSAAQATANRTQQFHQFFVGVALVQKNRQLRISCKFKLFAKRLPLGVAWRKVPVEIQPALAYGDHLLLRQQLAQGVAAVLVKPGRVMRVNPGGRKQLTGAGLGKFQGTNAFRHRRTRDDQPAHTGSTRLPEDLIAIPVETLMGQIGPDINQVRHVNRAFIVRTGYDPP